MNYSIRRHLLTYLTVALLVSSVTITVVTYLVAGEELDELYDENMKQIGTVLLEQNSGHAYFPTAEHTQQTSLHGEEEFLIQIWDQDDQLLYSSHPAITYTKQSPQGYGDSEFDDANWRYFSASKEGKTVQISQRLGDRQDAIMEVSSKFLIPLLLQIPLFGFLIWSVVGRSLKPLNLLSQAIHSRNPDVMHPLPDDHVPMEIKPLVLALNELLERLDRALKAQRRFTADAAHELRTPLTAVQLQLDLLKRSKSEKDKQEALDKLGNGIKRSIHVVRQLLSLAHQEPEARKRGFEKVDLAAILHESAIPFEAVAKKKHIVLHVSETKKPDAINGDPSSLRILIENLLDNAIRYTPEGGKVEASIASEGDTVTLSIADNGVGIPTEQRDCVFDRFYRITGTEESGTGLGLSIVKSIADQHHATIHLDNGLEGQGISINIMFSING